MGLFKGMESATGTYSGTWFQPGKFVVTVQRIMEKKGFRGHFFIVETAVKTSDNPEVKPGSSRSQTIKLDDLGTWKSNFRSLADAIAETYGYDKSAVNEDFCENIVAGDGMNCAGIKLGLEVSLIKTKAGNDFHKHCWSCVEKVSTT